jgi:hypothetical protein
MNSANTAPSGAHGLAKTLILTPITPRWRPLAQRAHVFVLARLFQHEAAGTSKTAA